MKKARIASTLLAVALLCSSFAGCNSQPDSSSKTGNASKSVSSTAQQGSETSTGTGEKVKLRFAHYSVGTHLGAKTMAEVLDGFREKYGDTIELEIEELPTDTTYNEKMKTLVATDDLPDLIDGKNGLRDLALQKGRITYLNEYMDADPQFRDVVIGADALAANTDADGNILSVTMDVQAVGYFYNKNMFEAAGIEPAKTWDEFTENCEKLLQAGYTPLGLMTGENSWTTNLLLAAMIGGEGEDGVKLMNTKYPETYQTPEVIAALETMQTYLQKYTTPDALGAGYANVANNFLTEQVAMVFNGPWMIASFSEEEKANPGLADHIGFAMYPGDGMIQTYNEGYCITAKTKETQDAAWLLLRELQSTETQEKRVKLEGSIPTSAEAVITEEYRQENPLFAQNVDAVSKSKYGVATFDVMAYASVVDAFGIYYPELAAGTLDAAGMAVKLDEAAASAQ